MNCPNDRYVNDGDLPGAGRQPRADRRQGQPDDRDQGELLPGRSCAATPASTCSADPEHGRLNDTLASIMATPNEKGQGQLGAYSNPKLDELVLKIRRRPTEEAQRHDPRGVQDPLDDVGHIPCTSRLAWAAAKSVQFTQLNNYMYLGGSR